MTKSCSSCFSPVDKLFKLPTGEVCEACYEKQQEDDGEEGEAVILCALCRTTAAATHVHAYPVCQECRLAYEAVHYESTRGSHTARRALKLAEQRFDEAERYKSAETLVSYALKKWVLSSS